MTYALPADLLLGDIIFSAESRERYLLSGEEEMDAALAQTFVLPLTPRAPLTAIPPHTLLQLKNCAVKLASGRALVDRAAGGEDEALHAYGESLLAEGRNLLQGMVTGAIVMPLVQIETVEEEGNAPSLINFDGTSAVDAFYSFTMGGRRSGYRDPATPIWRPGEPARRPVTRPGSSTADLTQIYDDA